MIRRARQRDRDGAHLEFHVCDVLKLTPADHGTFDIAISTRCLINILDEEQQYRAIDNIAGILKPGGRFVFIEGLSQGRERLNVLRQKVDLPEMPKVWHNLDFEETRLLREMKKRFTILERSDFGTYDLISRVVYPLSIRPDEPKYDAKLNEVAARLALTWGTSSDISRVIVLVLQA
jgi:SAM-dependent methyltransferase